MPSIARLNAIFWLIIFYLGADDFDTENTHVTKTGVAYRRRIAAASIANNSVLQCSMQFKQSVQPTATLPELTDSPIPPNYTHVWNSPPILVVGEYVRH